MNNLIFTTKGITSKPVWGLWVTILFIPIASFLILPIFLAVILSMIVGVACGVSFVKINACSKSYIDIYDDKISGIDGSSGPVTFFELRYDEIIRLDRQEGLVRIHVQNGSYTVKAPGCEQKVINLIEERKNYLKKNDSALDS